MEPAIDHRSPQLRRCQQPVSQISIISATRQFFPLCGCPPQEALYVESIIPRAGFPGPAGLRSGRRTRHRGDPASNPTAVDGSPACRFWRGCSSMAAVHSRTCGGGSEIDVWCQEPTIISARHSASPYRHAAPALDLRQRHTQPSMCQENWLRERTIHDMDASVRSVAPTQQELERSKQS